MSTKVRVMVVDDSSFFRHRITRTLEESDEIEVIGQATNGGEAVEMARRLRPDLITMDVEMPVMNGIQAVKRILSERQVDIVMFSSLTKEGATATLDALDAGAVDFLPKHDSSERYRSNSGALRDRVLAIARRKRNAPPALGRTLPRHRPAPNTLHHSVARARQAPASELPASPAVSRPRTATARVEMLVIGASTGGPVALQQILTALPGNLRVPVLVGVHMPAAFTATFADRLNQLCALEVREARDGDPLRPGAALIAPGGRQTLLSGRPNEPRIQLTDDPQQIYKPSIDLCFGSAARLLGANVLAVVLTGMGADGAQGARLLKSRGAQVWSQNAATCVVYGMPQAVEKAGLSDRVLPLDQIGKQIIEAL